MYMYDYNYVTKLLQLKPVTGDIKGGAQANLQAIHMKVTSRGVDL